MTPSSAFRTRSRPLPGTPSLTHPDVTPAIQTLPSQGMRRVTPARQQPRSALTKLLAGRGIDRCRRRRSAKRSGRPHRGERGHLSRPRHLQSLMSGRSDRCSRIQVPCSARRSSHRAIRSCRPHGLAAARQSTSMATGNAVIRLMTTMSTGLVMGPALARHAHEYGRGWTDRSPATPARAELWTECRGHLSAAALPKLAHPLRVMRPAAVTGTVNPREDEARRRVGRS